MAIISHLISLLLLQSLSMLKRLFLPMDLPYLILMLYLFAYLPLNNPPACPHMLVLFHLRQLHIFLKNFLSAAVHLNLLQPFLSLRRPSHRLQDDLICVRQPDMGYLTFLIHRKAFSTLRFHAKRLFYYEKVFILVQNEHLLIAVSCHLMPDTSSALLPYQSSPTEDQYQFCRSGHMLLSERRSDVSDQAS